MKFEIKNTVSSSSTVVFKVVSTTGAYSEFSAPEIRAEKKYGATVFTAPTISWSSNNLSAEQASEFAEALTYALSAMPVMSVMAKNFHE